MPQIIGFIGVIGSGKNYQRDLLISKGFVGLDFKDSLIEMVEDIIGYSIKDDYELFKQTIIGMTAPTAPKLSPEILIEHTRKILSDYPEAMTGRRLLQRVGTEVMRKRDADYWVKEWTRKANAYVEKGISVAVADVRFKNELEAISMFKLKQDAKVEPKCIFCNYKSDRYDAASPHPSEALAQTFLSLGMKDGQEIDFTLLPSQ